MTTTETSTETLRDTLAEYRHCEVEMVVSTGYGSVKGELWMIGEDFLVLSRGEDKPNLIIALAHVVTFWVK